MRAAIMFALMTTVAHGQLLLERDPATLPFEVTLAILPLTLQPVTVRSPNRADRALGAELCRAGEGLARPRRQTHGWQGRARHGADRVRHDARPGPCLL